VKIEAVEDAFYASAAPPVSFGPIKWPVITLPPLTPPTVEVVKLYTALVYDYYHRTSVTAVCGIPLTEESSTFDDWTEGPAGTWTRDLIGPFDTGVWTDGVSPIAAGDRLLVGDVSTLPSPGLVQGTYAGIYEVLEPGTADPETYAVIKRAPDADESADFISGMWCLVLEGDVHGGEYRQLQTSDPIVLGTTDQTWVSVSEPAVQSTDSLLTAAQLWRASGATVISTLNVPGGSTLQLLDAITFDSLAGQILKAGEPWEFHVRACLTADDPAATSTISCVIRGGDDGLLKLVATSAAMHNTNYETLVFTGALEEDYYIHVGDQLHVYFWAYTTSAGSVEFNLIYNESDHPTWLLAPLGALALAAGPSRPHPGMGVATETGGMVTMPDNMSQATLAIAGASLLGISSAGSEHGDEIMIVVTNATTGSPKSLINNSACAWPYKPLSLIAMAGVAQACMLKGPSTCLFWYDQTNGVWRLKQQPTTYVVPT